MIEISGEMVVSKKQKRGSATSNSSHQDSVKKHITSSQLGNPVVEFGDILGSHPSPVYSPLSYPKEDHAKGYHKQNVKCAEKSLEHYNKEKGTNYELVEALVSNCIFKPGGVGFHCNFTAKPRNQNDYSSTELFFGELIVVDSFSVTYEVTYCDILKDESHSCKECGKNTRMKHPPSQFLTPSFVDMVEPKEREYADEDTDGMYETSSHLSDSVVDGGDVVGYPPSPVYSLFSTSANAFEYEAPPPYEYPKEDHAKGYHKQNVKCAERSLEHYNKEKGTNYELVEALVSNCIFKPGGVGFHCNFTAKPINQNDYSSTELFFGELIVVDSFSVTYEVTYCDILKDDSHSCKECGNDTHMKHPPSQFLTPSYGDVL